MYIVDIIWPDSNQELKELLVSFKIQVVEPLHLEFPPELNNPIEIAKLYLADKISEELCDKEYNLWWKYVEDRNAVTKFTEKDILLARLAICLVSTNANSNNAGQSLGWFLEVLDFLRIDKTHARELMESHFTYKK